MNAVELHTFHGRIKLWSHTGTARCSLGCGRRGGGMAIMHVTGKEGREDNIVACGDCLASALVSQIARNGAA